MKVVLRDVVDKLGKTGDVVNVKKGYARNYLLPKKLAVAATPGALKMVEELRQQRLKKAMKGKAEAEELASMIEEKSITIKAKASPMEKLYGSVTERDIARLLKEQHGIEIDRHNVFMNEHIKKLGSHTVKIVLHSETEVNLPVWVIRKEENN
ncbi:50S ribosomal protein L9 [candidate division WOR-3 bacterium]|nr:50S ribosomal protein L9 [candidate division WOR-3 bacterium]